MLCPEIAGLLIVAGASLVRGQGSPAPTLAPRRIGEHTAAITHLALSSDGKVLFSAASDLEIHAWDLKKSRLLWKTSSVAAITYEIAGLAAGKDSVLWTGGAVHASYFDQETGERIARTGGVSPAVDPPLSLIADRKDRWVWIGTASQLHRITPGNPTTGWGLRAMPNGGTLSFAADESGQLLAIGGRDGVIRFMNPTASQLIEDKLFEGHPGAVTALAIDPKGKVLVSGCQDGSLRQWDLKQGEPSDFPSAHRSAVVGLAFDPKGKRLASSDDGGTVKVWEAGTRDELVALAVAPAASLDVIFLDDVLLAVPDGDRVAIWDLGKP